MIDSLTESYRNVIGTIGEDPNREGLLDTPARAAKALEFLTSGYRQDLETIVNGAVFESDNDEMVVVRDVELYSMCEHHMLPFTGRCHIGYLPDGKVLGLSKFARITDMFARRLQIQENLTRQIALAGCDWRTRCWCGDRGPTLLHDDARSAKAKLDHGNLGDVRRFSRASSDTQ